MAEDQVHRRRPFGKLGAEYDLTPGGLMLYYSAWAVSIVGAIMSVMLFNHVLPGALWPLALALFVLCSILAVLSSRNGRKVG